MTHVRGCPLFTHPTQREPGHPTNCTCPPVSGDTERVVDYFRSHPGATRGEAQQALGWIHVTARMSDARVRGVVFDKWRDGKAWRFRVREARPAPLLGVQESAGLL